MSFNFIDLCAGIGGFRIGLESVGGRCVFTAEWDKFARQTYQVNFGGVVDAHDINEIDPETVPDHDVLACGFPCVSFSNAGRRQAFDDPRTEVFWSTMDIIKAKTPKVVLFENVRGILKHRDMIAKVFDDLGYDLHHSVINSKDFGVPQNRIRVYMVATRRDAFAVPFEFPQVRENSSHPVLGDVLEGTLGNGIDDRYELSNKMWGWLKAHTAKHTARGNGFGVQVKTVSDISSTLTQRYYKDGAECIIDDGIAGRNPRKLTPRESARIMGFPDTFEIPVSNTQAYRQFGNSVCPPVIRAIGMQLIAMAVQARQHDVPSSFRMDN